MNAKERCVLKQMVIFDQWAGNGDDLLSFQMKYGIAAFRFAINDIIEFENDKTFKRRKT